MHPTHLLTDPINSITISVGPCQHTCITNFVCNTWAGKAGEAVPPPLDPSSNPPANQSGAGSQGMPPPLPKRRAKRTKVRSLRLTPAEDAEFTAKLAGRDLSEVVRALMFGASIPEPRNKVVVRVKRPKVTSAEAEYLRQLAAFGNNLNQIARRSNEGAHGTEILAALIALERTFGKGRRP